MRRFFTCFAVFSGLFLVFSSGCGDDGTGGSGATGGSGGSGGGAGATGGAGGGGPQPVCTDPVAVPCEDEVILQMNLQPDPAPGLISNTADGADWVSLVDATAGGAFATTPDSYVYARFTANGLEKVDISDEDSLTSMDWDIAFRRYVVRINSGHSGPSCVTAARVPSTTYDELTTLPDNLTFHKDEYFTDTCELIADGTGLPGSPATALASYWTYPGCVSMTKNVYAIELQDGRHVKFTVELYYNEAAQAQCDTSGSVPMNNNGSANFQVRWAEL
ncbi:MAG: HmuY family protein [Polyangiaceae bacterium]